MIPIRLQTRLRQIAFTFLLPALFAGHAQAQMPAPTGPAIQMPPPPRFGGPPGLGGKSVGGVEQFQGVWEADTGDLYKVFVSGDKITRVEQHLKSRPDNPLVFTDVKSNPGNLNARLKLTDPASMKGRIPAEHHATNVRYKNATAHFMMHMLDPDGSRAGASFQVFYEIDLSKGKSLGKGDKYSVLPIYKDARFTRLTLKLTGRKEYRIGELKFDLNPWFMSFSETRLKRDAYEKELREARADRKKSEAEAQQQSKRRQAAANGLTASLQAEQDARKKLQDIAAPPGKSYLLDEIAVLEDEIETLTIKRGLEKTSLANHQKELDAGTDNAYFGPLVARNKRALADYNDQLALKNKLLARKRAALDAVRANVAGTKDYRAVMEKLQKDAAKHHYDAVRKKTELGWAEDDEKSSQGRIKTASDEVEKLEAALKPLKEALDRMKKRGKGVKSEDTFISAFWVEADGKPVYAMHVDNRDERLKALDEEIETLRGELRDARVQRDKVTADFTAAHEEARAALDTVASRIMTSAIGQSVVEAGMFGYEMLEAFGEGGPGGALFAAGWKTVEWTVLGGPGAKGVDESEIEKDIMRELTEGQRDGMSFSARSYETADYLRGAVLKRSKKTALKATLGRQIQAGVFRRELTQYAFDTSIKRRAALLQWLKKKAPDSYRYREILKRKGKKIGAMIANMRAMKTKNFPLSKELFTPGKIWGAWKEFYASNREKLNKDMKKGLTKDAIKTLAKEAFIMAEKKAWQAYYRLDFYARSLFGAWQSATRHYWELRDQLDTMLDVRRQLLEGYDEKAHIVIETDESFTDRQKLAVFTGTKFAADGSGWETLSADKYDLSIDKIAGRPSGRSHRLDAKNFTAPSGSALPVTVTVK
jgi:hypothetical protein